ncbi:MAG: oxidoreductase molybdopterin binding protein [Acidobacteriaceae bacterium]|nr:oxidoreductase molybdopterin binding protein [Acidobacteriaceae bacterium]
MTDEETVAALDEQVKRASGKRTRRSFLAAVVAAAGGYGFYRWIDRSPGDQMIPRPLRKGLNVDEAMTRGVFGERGMTPTYPVARAEELRVNGVYGLKQELIPESWRLQLVGVAGAKQLPQYVDDVTAWEYRYAAKKDEKDSGNHDTKVAPQGEASDTGVKMSPAFEAAFAELKKTQGKKRPRGQEEAGESNDTLDAGTPGLLLKMEDVTRFPRQELVTQFKCIEGWSQIVHWGGVRLADLLAAYPPEKRADGSLPKYVYMETPDGDYYCGYDLKACMHAQSLLVTEMMGRPLGQWHGAPLRLHMPIKYGYKQIKRIGLIAYTDMRPDDYWTKLGYDWYAGL